MPTISWISGTRILAASCVLACSNALAQTSTPLLSEVHTIAAATQGVPVEETVDIAAAGTYQVTLTDLGAQLSPAAPLASAQLAISTGNTLVGTPLVATSGSTSWSTTFTATPGTYVLHVVGAPSTQQNSSGATVPVPGSGPIGLQVTNTANNAQVAAFSGSLALPSTGVPTNVGTLSDSFTVSTAGSYQVTLVDMQLPVALTTLTLAIAEQGGALLTDPAFGTTPTNPVATTTVSLQPGVTYRIFAGGQAGGTVSAGLYGVNVSPAGSTTPVYSHTVPVGAVVAVGTPTLTSGSFYTLGLADLTFPTALSQVGAALTVNGGSAAALTATGTSSPVTAGAGTYQVFAFGLAASGGQGSYTVTLQPTAGTPVLSVARAVSDSTSGVFAYSFDSTTVGGESYSFDLADFGYPTSFASLKAAAVQNGALLGNGASTPVTSLTAAGSLTITPAAGPVTMLVFAQPPAAASAAAAGGLFGIDLTASGAGAPAFQTSQGVGQLFSVRTVTVTTGGNYQVAVNDLAFPAKFANLAVIVTRGTSKIGSIFGGGTLPFAAVGGDYLINFVAQPDATALAGTYSLVVGEAPPPATATLQVSPTSVNSGGTVTLTWSSTNATSCTASSSPSGAWSGTVATSGTATSAALTATTSFTLTCVGSDGTNPTSTQTVSLNSTSSGGKGGGGAIRWDLLVFLLGSLTLRVATDGRVTPGIGSRSAASRRY
jgi:hypothetical protein